MIPKQFCFVWIGIAIVQSVYDTATCNDSRYEKVAYTFLVKGTLSKHVRVQAGLKLMAREVITLSARVLHDSFFAPIHCF